ncbi:xanthine dehydrogenase [Tetragenococcus halophilus subsp. flandriensis]|uniref:xanthine dehydrogenase subunit XdhC n=1 Tax=Tetragenococcus halophilus TaxID=51669 RepID=UPI0023E93329|nr:xanthine dehydrogenase subunit XdhC [Tetragenococcus halophilus]GMA09300.1 xanthine dehydrogenase [Tetragenococcus halophilus subsp. flandriensis]
MNKEIRFLLNNEEISCMVDIRKSLLEVLRENFSLTGTKEGCSVGECGACTVLVEGQTVDSCIYLAAWADGKSITTIEGMENIDGSLSDIQQEFIDSGAVQCGFCIPGMILSSHELLEDNDQLTRNEIRRGISGNMCRCTGYQKIIGAVEKTVERRSANKKVSSSN